MAKRFAHPLSPQSARVRRDRRPSGLVEIAVVAALLAAGSPAAAQLLVIDSAAEALSPGALLAPGTAMRLENGETATLMDPSGAMLALTGPWEGVAPASAVEGEAGVMEAVGAVVAGRRMARTVGATRGDGDDAGATPALDLLGDAAFCLVGAGGPDLALPPRPRARLLRITGAGGEAELVWPAGAARAPWPPALPARADATYDATLDGVAVGRFILRAPGAASGATPGARAAALHRAGCDAQAAAALTAR